MAGLFKKIAKWSLIGAGSVLSLFAPMIGAPLIVAGSGIATGKMATNDKVSGYANNLQTSINTAAAMQSASTNVQAVVFFDRVKIWFLNNWKLILIVVGAIVILPRLIPKIKRRRR